MSNAQATQAAIKIADNNECSPSLSSTAGRGDQLHLEKTGQHLFKDTFQLFRDTFRNQDLGHLFPLPRINIGRALLDYKRIAVNILPQVANFQESHLVKNAVKSPNESLPAVLGLDGKHC